jgi:hypothetical protein
MTSTWLMSADYCRA